MNSLLIASLVIILPVSAWCAEVEVVSDFGEVLELVADEMKIQVSRDKPLPLIIKSGHFIVSCYYPTNNFITLTHDSDIETLAHELVHYFQAKYRGTTEDIGMFLEKEAILISEKITEKIRKEVEKK